MIPRIGFNKYSIPYLTTGYLTTRNLVSIPSSAQYDNQINSVGRKGDLDAVRRLLCERLRHGVVTTSNTFKFVATNAAALDDLLQHLAALDGDWFARKHVHDSLVAQLARVQRTSEALRVATTMAARHHGATAATFHPVINALAQRREMDAAWRAVETMRAFGVKPDRTCFNHILTAYCVLGDVTAAGETVERMEVEGLKGDVITYDALILGTCRAGRVEAALALMGRMVGGGLWPLSSSQLHVVKEMVARGYYATAVEYVRIISGRNKKLDGENFGYLAKRLIKMKRFAEAESVVEEMVERKLPIEDGLITN